MIDENFFGLEPGSMGNLYYYEFEEIAIDPKDEQRFMDSQTNEFSNTFDPPPGLSPDEYSTLFAAHFMKSRQQSRNVIEQNKRQLVRKSTMFQHGNPECRAEIDQIEKNPKFEKWENPTFIDTIRRFS